MEKFVVVYVRDGKEGREIVVLERNSTISTTRAFNEFWRKVKKRGWNKRNTSVKSIYLVS